jgi:hypothetical protein
VDKAGTSKAGGTISQQAVVHPWLAADAHGNKLENAYKGPVFVNTQPDLLLVNVIKAIRDYYEANTKRLKIGCVCFRLMTSDTEKW